MEDLPTCFAVIAEVSQPGNAPESFIYDYGHAIVLLLLDAEAMVWGCPLIKANKCRGKFTCPRQLEPRTLSIFPLD